MTHSMYPMHADAIELNFGTIRILSRNDVNSEGAIDNGYLRVWAVSEATLYAFIPESIMPNSAYIHRMENSEKVYVDLPLSFVKNAVIEFMTAMKDQQK